MPMPCAQNSFRMQSIRQTERPPDFMCDVVCQKAATHVSYTEKETGRCTQADAHRQIRTGNSLVATVRRHTPRTPPEHPPDTPGTPPEHPKNTG